ncbi:TPM domain-containing protein [Ferviditalea candida]|uniref:TPM domain-containing protein n=1 Tax=Ferviditalea candida TaxID=3108399 RepID=A0ABU5ZHZ8_9BACL|nr:TPM domain-containing protein [Paenibacillaceae bacterium T2]
MKRIYEFQRARHPAAAALLLLLIMLFSGMVTVYAESPFGVYVQDDAKLLQTQTKQALYNNAIWLKEKTGTAQVGVVTLPSLEGRTIEEIAVDKFRQLGLGDKQRNDGVLLLYAKDENRVRIEVGYGLEGAIPDGKAGEILDRYFLPNMKSGAVDQAFYAAQAAIIGEVAKEYNINPAEMERQGIPRTQYSDQQNLFAGMPGYMKLLIAIGIAFLIFLDFRFFGGMLTWGLLSMLRRGGGGGGWGGGRGGGGSSGGGGASR